MDSEAKLIDQGIPAQTVEKMEEPQVYLNPCMINGELSSYSSDFSYSIEDLEDGLCELSADLDRNLVRYKDQTEFGSEDHDVTRYAFSENSFTTALVIEDRSKKKDEVNSLAWIVDTEENTSFYLNDERNEFLPAYGPEVVDPLPQVSSIWEDAKRELESQEEVNPEQTFNRIGPHVRNQTRTRDLRG